MTKRVLVFLAVALLAAVSAASCGDDDDDDGGGAGATSTATPAAATATPDDAGPTPGMSPGGASEITPPPGNGAFQIVTRNFAFDPPELTVPAGEPVTFQFTNEDSVPHTFTLYLDEAYTQPLPGGSATEAEPEITVAFVDPGRYYFRCEVHPTSMQGDLTAE